MCQGGFVVDDALPPGELERYIGFASVASLARWTVPPGLLADLTAALLRLEDIPRYSQPLNVSCRYDSGSDKCSGSAYPWHPGANVNNNQAPLGGEYGGAWLRNRDV